jgi:alanine racemase
MRYRPTVVDVDLEAVRHNVRTLKPADAELMAIVKANGYGHGDVAVARAALEAGASRLGVALVEEGVRLRDAGIEVPILVLSEFPRGSEREALAADLTPSLYSEEGLAALVAAGSPGRGVGVHVKVDTGMHRVGLYPPESTPAFVRRVASSGLRVEGLWTHLARSEEDVPATKEQLERFVAAVDALDARPACLHAANSAATILHPESHFDLVRTGIAIYGLEPAPGVATGLNLRPALTWRSAVTMVKRLPAGEAVSYQHRYRLERDATIATVPVGYEDGYLRSLSSKADVLIRGRRRRVAGNVTMDQILVDCADEEVAPGDEVVLLGRQDEEEVSAAELAELMDSISYEVVTTIGDRVPREYPHA